MEAHPLARRLLRIFILDQLPQLMRVVVGAVDDPVSQLPQVRQGVALLAQSLDDGVLVRQGVLAAGLAETPHQGGFIRLQKDDVERVAQFFQTAKHLAEIL